METNQTVFPRPGFSLLELLAVIAIISLLLGLVLPAALALRQSARQREAALQAQTLVQAIMAYRNVYGKWPTQVQDAQDKTYTNSSDIIAALTTDSARNPRQIQFIEIPANSLKDGCYVDPWSRSFVIAMDENGDGMVTLDLPPSVFGTALVTNIPNETVAVASGGAGPAREAKRIYSWSR